MPSDLLDFSTVNQARIRSRSITNENERIRTNINMYDDTAIMTIGFAESEDLELKKIWSARALKSVSAFANGSGGTIIVGVDDDGTLVGVDDPDNVCTSITSSISDNIRPNPIGMISLEIEVVDGKNIIRVFVGRGLNRPYYVKEKGLKEGGGVHSLWDLVRGGSRGLHHEDGPRAFGGVVRGPAVHRPSADVRDSRAYIQRIWVAAGEESDGVPRNG